MPFTNLKINGVPVWMPEGAARLLSPQPLAPTVAAGAVAGAAAGAVAPAAAQAPQPAPTAQAPTAAEKQSIRQAVAPAPLIQVNVNLSGDVATKLLLARGLAKKAEPAPPTSAAPSAPTPPPPTIAPPPPTKMMESTARAVGGPIAGALYGGMQRRGLVP